MSFFDSILNFGKNEVSNAGNFFDHLIHPQSPPPQTFNAAPAVSTINKATGFSVAPPPQNLPTPVPQAPQPSFFDSIIRPVTTTTSGLVKGGAGLTAQLAAGLLTDQSAGEITTRDAQGKVTDIQAGKAASTGDVIKQALIDKVLFAAGPLAKTAQGLFLAKTGFDQIKDLPATLDAINKEPDTSNKVSLATQAIGGLGLTAAGAVHLTNGLVEAAKSPEAQNFIDSYKANPTLSDQTGSVGFNESIKRDEAGKFATFESKAPPLDRTTEAQANLQSASAITHAQALLDNIQKNRAAGLPENPADIKAYNSALDEAQRQRMSVSGILKDQGGSIGGSNLPAAKPSSLETLNNQFDTLNLRPKFNADGSFAEKATAADTRAAYSGLKDQQVVMGTQVGDAIAKATPKDELNALSWYNEAKGNIELLRKWADDTSKSLDPYRADIQKAANLSDAGKEAAAKLSGYYQQAAQRGQATGALTDLRDNYNNRLYTKDGGKVTGDTIPNLKRNTSHDQSRFYDTLYDAVKAGKTPATTNAVDLMKLYNEELAKVSTNRVLVSALERTNLGTYADPNAIPAGFSKLTNVTKDGKSFVVPDFLATGLKAITDPNFVNKIDPLRNVNKYQALVKTIDLSVSFFHYFSLLKQAMSETKLLGLAKLVKLGTSNDFNAMEQDFAANTGITSKISDRQSILAELGNSKEGLLAKIAEFPGVKQASGLGEALIKANNDLLFGKLQRWLKVTDYTAKASTWIDKHPNATEAEIVAAKRGFAKEVNASYGGLNWEALNKTPSAVGVARLLLLAPDWTYSNLYLGKYALSDTGTAGNAARARFVTGLVGGALATEGLNHALTGHYTDQNEKGHQYEVEVRPGIYMSFLPADIKDALNLATNIQNRGPVGGIAQSAQSKLAPFPRTAVGLLSNTNAYGQPITTSKQSMAEKAVSSLQFLSSSAAPVPFGASTTGTLLAGGNTDPASIALLATGLGRQSSRATTKAITGKGSAKIKSSTRVRVTKISRRGKTPRLSKSKAPRIRAVGVRTARLHKVSTRFKA